MNSIFYLIGVVVVVLIGLGERRRLRSDSLRDVLALVVGTAVLMVVWFAVWDGTYRLSPEMQMDAHAVGSPPVSAIGASPTEPVGGR